MVTRSPRNIPAASHIIRATFLVNLKCIRKFYVEWKCNKASLTKSYFYLNANLDENLFKVLLKKYEGIQCGRENTYLTYNFICIGV